ncbi:MAG: Aromatic/aminoadipate aminotransferase 1 [Bathelium mastoideum]|nr:MAG: Aromatic/aminoadipate aminotransferase 1 [Bathelium mastoideum]KAI9693870.1 MAG: Aromatic/aminoadipate aminotransferase 1 [Bathelium mastoideum]
MRGVNYSDDERESSTDSTLSMPCITGESAYDLSLALNYGYAAGSPQVLRFITEHVELIHKPPYRDWESCLTCGTTSAINIALQMFCDPGDWILVEEYTYSGTIDAAKAQNLNILGLKMDEFGLSPEDLDLKLSTWDIARGKKPFILYTVPSGHNPTGITQSRSRRNALYQVAEKHDLYIIEDDPYYFLQLGFDGSAEVDTLKPTNHYLQQLPTSYLSLDVSGRVMRLDATSKILAPGLRCGWLTASSQVVQKFIVHTENSTQSTSGPSQVMLYKLLDEAWGHEGFLTWLRHLSMQYSHRRDILTQACEQYLPTNICSWTVPSEGMFLWIRFDVHEHPAVRLRDFVGYGTSVQLDIEHKIYSNAKEKGVLVSKGSWFAAEKGQSQDTYFRITFAAASAGDLNEAVKRFGAAVREEFRCT